MPDLSAPAALPLASRIRMSGDDELFTLDDSFTALAIYSEHATDRWFSFGGVSTRIVLPAQQYFVVWQKPENAGTTPVDYTVTVHAMATDSADTTHISYMAW